MKKLSLIMAVMMVITAFTAVIAVPTSAATDPFRVEGVTYATWDEAWAAARDLNKATTIEILSDVTIEQSARWIGGHTTPTNNVTVEGNGHTITYTGSANDYGWKIDNGLTYTVTIQNLTFNTIGRFQLMGKVVLDNVDVISSTTRKYAWSTSTRSASTWLCA